MRTLIDDTTGTTCFIPESESDRLLLYHLMNCNDLNHLPEYLALEQKNDDRPVSSELGTPVRLLDSYPVCTLWDNFGPTAEYSDNDNGKIKDGIRPITTPPDEECLYHYLKTADKRKIGFRLDSKESDGWTFKPVTH